VSITAWQLLLGALALAGRHIANPADPQIFPSVFGMVLSVLIALEFNELHGDKMLEATTLTDNQTGQQHAVETCCLFRCLGGAPNTDWARLASCAMKKTIW
jgi:thioredoxin reductase